ncbi:putative GTP-binding protein [Candidatus Nitrososphaera gargensis Ga9.2]|uniref:Putative GTP-binding protein n=1 Tax=Nitrososphaera gargensis (strain Ga9.2) TaxID=1237085 RepID=K0IDU6_NITGG|nr:GTPase HflX [Candidatus Nitrososphaera gargensis]AFU56988.1 putative GTP-binding protein [Candidatus Nitrososphaera gargensis Ga9.2]
MLRLITWTGLERVSTKTILVSYPDSFRLEEGKSLVESADCKIVKIFTQKYLNHSQYGIGAGKAEEIRDFVKGEEEGIQQLVVDEHLTSKQLYNLSKLVEVQAIDRERLILNIFYSRATTTEAKLQIELAEIQYEIPRVREIAKMTSGNERAGKGGMGEYTVDVKFRDLKRRMNFIREKLVEAKKKRDLYHQQRTRTQMPVVSLVGYTGSGKTTLFNLLTKEHRETSSSLFTTLSTTTRVMKFNDEKQGDLLLTDTVGFISRLPPYMIDAFKSTLEESLAAHLILLLVDASEDVQNIDIKYSSCWDVLDELKVDHAKVLVVLTKQDAVDAQKMQEVMQQLQLKEPIMIISSKTGYGIRKLKNMMVSKSRPKMVGGQP